MRLRVHAREKTSSSLGFQTVVSNTDNPTAYSCLPPKSQHENERSHQRTVHRSSFVAEPRPLCGIFLVILFERPVKNRPQASVKHSISHIDTRNKRETSLFLKLVVKVKQRGLWWSTHPEPPPQPPSPPHQSPIQSISSSQSVLRVCWMCFGTRWPLIDTGAEAGKTLLWCSANNSLSVTPPQMFSSRAQTAITFILLFSFPFLPVLLFLHFRFYFQLNDL